MKVRDLRCEVRIRRSSARIVGSGFTIIEIALCLGIIAFALVAIIGVLPFGMRVQQQNREETIINQDATVWMESIRSGAQGYDDLTNYVISITNHWTRFKVSNGSLVYDTDNYDSYWFSGSAVTSIAPPPNYPLTNGMRIIGLLSMPTRWPEIVQPPFQNTPVAFQSNYVTAYVRAISGAAVDKAPQDNQAILEDAFKYKVIVENFPYIPVDTNATCFDCPATNNMTLQQLMDRTNSVRIIETLWTNTHDVRLTFRWPILPNNEIGIGRQTFRVLNGSGIVQTNDPYDPNNPVQPLYFFRPSTYVQVK